MSLGPFLGSATFLMLAAETGEGVTVGVRWAWFVKSDRQSPFRLDVRLSPKTKDKK